jgi:hypothetical protein
MARLKKVVEKDTESALDKVLTLVLESIGIVQIPGTNTHVSFVIKTKGKEVLDIAIDQPDIHAIAIDQAKVNFVHKFMPHEG